MGWGGGSFSCLIKLLCVDFDNNVVDNNVVD